MKRYYEGYSLADMLASLQRDYLTDSGWLLSAEQKAAVDNAGPVPWITYAALEMLKRIVQPEWHVFEYGAGNSTLWWNARVNRVVSVEDNAEWVAYLNARGVSVQHASGPAYVQAIRAHEDFDVVVIDGADRVECCLEAMQHVKPDGFILFDNSDRDEYAAAYESLAQARFARIDFSGLGPINPYGWVTSVFTRSLRPFISRLPAP